MKESADSGIALSHNGSQISLRSLNKGRVRVNYPRAQSKGPKQRSL